MEILLQLQSPCVQSDTVKRLKGHPGGLGMLWCPVSPQQKALCPALHPAEAGKALSLPARCATGSSLSSSVPSADCQPTHFGPDCRLACQCAPSSYCNARNGQCLCLDGHTGPTCREGEGTEGTTVPEPEGRLDLCSGVGPVPGLGLGAVNQLSPLT